MLSFGLARSGAGRLYRFVNNLGVPLSSYNSLRNYNLAANAAMLTLGEACFGTGSFDSLINNLGVTTGIDGFYLLFATSAIAYLLAILGTGWLFGCFPFAEAVSMRTVSVAGSKQINEGEQHDDNAYMLFHFLFPF